ncbi:MAG: hypothetical protein ACOYXR_12345 [Nitrospirota bacterium]
MVDVWRKIREDGSTGFLALLAGAIRGGRALPETLRLRWNLRDTRVELDAAYAELGEYLTEALHAGGAVEPNDERARGLCGRIDELLAAEQRLRDELSRGSVP